MALGTKAILSISLAVAIVGGGGYAAYSFMNADVDIASVVPSNAAAFANLDSSPSLKQGKSALEFIDRVNEAWPQDDKDDEIHITAKHFEGLDEKEMVDPWIGDKVAWIIPDDAISEKTINSIKGDMGIEGASVRTAEAIAEQPDVNVEGASIKESPAVKSVTIYEVKDTDKAQKAIDAMKGKNSLFYVIDGKFMYVTDSEGTYTKYQADLKKGSLAETDTYKQDKKLIGDNVGYAWFDFGKVYDMAEKSGANTSTEKMDIEGRGISAISFEKDGMTLDTKFIDMTLNGEKTDKIDGKKFGSEALEALPSNSIVGFGIADLPKSIQAGWDDLVEQEPSVTEYASMAEEYLGIKVPSELDKLLGDNTSIGMDNDEKITIIAANSDKTVTEEVLNKLSEGDLGDVKINEKGKLVIVGNAAEYTETLGETPLFKAALPDADKSELSMFMNLTEISNSREKVLGDAGKESNVVKDMGAFGLTGAHDYDKNVTSFKVRWVLP